jgi:hypothetical protein
MKRNRDFSHVNFSPFEMLIVWPAVFFGLRAVAGFDIGAVALGFGVLLTLLTLS